MKTVTIPTCANPFVVIVNGIKYTYPAGTTVEVPDDVAAVIEQHDEAHNNPEPAPVMPPFATGASGGESGGGSAPSGGGLPVLDLTTAFGTTDEPTPLSVEETAIVSAAATANMPLVVRFSFNGVGMSALFNLMYGGIYIFMLEEAIAKFGFTLANEGDVWYAILEMIANE